MSARQTGRPAGRLIHAEAFEAICAARNLLKGAVAVEAGISSSYLADLLAHRGGASDAVQNALASALGVRPEALFPSMVGWASPLPDRDKKRDRVA